MTDIKLFNISGGVKECKSANVALERELQTLIEKNMNTFFGVTFLATEYSTTDGGRMDSLGIDENHCPVIFEYKRSIKENVIKQGRILKRRNLSLTAHTLRIERHCNEGQTYRKRR